MLEQPEQVKLQNSFIRTHYDDKIVEAGQRWSVCLSTTSHYKTAAWHSTGQKFGLQEPVAIQLV